MNSNLINKIDNASYSDLYMFSAMHMPFIDKFVMLGSIMPLNVLSDTQVSRMPENLSKHDAVRRSVLTNFRASERLVYLTKYEDRHNRTQL